MVLPTTYTDYRNLLREELAVRCQINPKYSLRAFARDIDLAPSRLSEVLSGKQGLSRQVAEKIGQRLGYNDSERCFFADLVTSIHARKESDRKAAIALVERKVGDQELLRLKNDTFHLISDWYHLAILELATTKDFETNVRWIAKKLNISESEVELALERLERFGFLGWDGDALVPLEPKTTTPGGTPSESIRKFHQQILAKAMDSVVMQGIEERDLSAVIVAVDRARLPEAKERLKQFRREFCTDMNKAPDKNSVYCLSIQFFSLTET